MMSERASAVVIGGGVVGCSIAYNLARKGLKDIVIIEKSYLTSGSTGRCAAGVRQQWGTEMNCLLSRYSVELFSRFKEEVSKDYDIEFKQKGYLLLAYTEKEWEQFKQNVALQNRLGIPSVLVSPQEALDIVPALNIQGLYGGAFCPTDGHCNPFIATLAYASAAQRLGVRIRQGEEVIGIRPSVKPGEQSRVVSGVITSRTAIDTPVVINAAGPWAKSVCQMVGIDIPVYTERHQIMVTEPVEPLIEPMLMSFSRHFYCQQTPHGSFIMGIGDPSEPKGYDIGHSWQFMERMSRLIVSIIPSLSDVRVVRQWSGLYTITPDSQPIIGQAQGIEGFYMAVGFSGHGFMLSPVVGVIISQIVLGEAPVVDVSRLDAARFQRGELVLEPSVV